MTCTHCSSSAKGGIKGAQHTSSCARHIYARHPWVVRGSVTSVVDATRTSYARCNAPAAFACEVPDTRTEVAVRVHEGCNGSAARCAVYMAGVER